MKSKSMPRLLVRLAIGVVLLLVLACRGAEEATPTPSAPTPTPTVFAPSPLILPTATATPLPGVTAVPTATNTPSPAGDQPKYGGALRFAGNPPQPTLDPYRAVGSNWGGELGAGNLWGQLIRLSPIDRRTVEPDIAESWSVSADGTDWTLKIRPDVLTHEGEPYTVDDAYWQIVRAVEKPNGLLTTRQSCIQKYVKPIWDDNGNPLPASQSGAEITGPDQLTIHLKSPGAGFVACFTGYSQVAQPAKYVKPIDLDPSSETRDLDYTKGEYVGMGPFKVKDIAVDNFYFLERFDQYFHPELPYLDEIQVFLIPEQSSWEAAFAIERIEFLGTSVGPWFISNASINRINQELGDGVDWPLVQAMGVCGFEVNVRHAPFGPPEDPNARKVRQAMNYALDRGEVNDLIYEGKAFLAMPYYIGWEWIYTQDEWLEQYRGFDSSPEAKARDIAEAKRLMEEAGYGPSNRLQAELLATANRSEEMQLYARQLEEIYLDITVQTAASGSDATARRRAGDFDLGQVCRGTNFPDPDSFNFDIHQEWEDGGQKAAGWTPPEWNRLGLEQALLPTNEARAPILRQMARIWHDESLVIGVLRPTIPFGYRTYVKNYFPPPYHFINYPMEHVWISQ